MKSIRPVLTEDEQKQLDEYFNFAAMSDNKLFLTEEENFNSQPYIEEGNPLSQDEWQREGIVDQIREQSARLSTEYEKTTIDCIALIGRYTDKKLKDLEKERDEFAIEFVKWWRKGKGEYDRKYVYGEIDMKELLEQFKQEK